ncbi:hypothetical protein [Micromonospora sp. WMMC250]|uniref:hypothetical protein n=1 Tax=Micromonospora sp. WMMC250 TaxID=3014781 RepID=UPI0022B709CA|nr:hypothetical protein [Micromonospora sp. WMMC250]MCZ7376557.1 hypothetical protein [Micromonospora sp. WMMC250]
MSQYSSPTPAAPVETKVKVATIFTYLGSLALLAILNGITSTNLIAGLPDVIEVFVAPMVPAAITLVSGYLAKHTPRPDLRRS